MNAGVVPVVPGSGVSSITAACKLATRETLIASGAWDEFCQWTNIWLMMPSVAYQLMRCLTPWIPGDDASSSLVGHCFADAAVHIRRWPQADKPIELVSDAMRSMMRRALSAAHYAVQPDKHSEPWRPDVDGPLEDFLRERGCERPIVTPRTVTGAIAETRVGVHRMLARHVYFGRCAPNLRRSYAELMQIPVETLR